MLETLIAPRTRPLEAVSRILPRETSLRVLPAMARFSLRVRVTADAPAAIAGFRLDQPINRCVTREGRTSVRLGPDEWLILAPEADAELIQEEVETSLHNTAHALVDISHRNVAFEIAGPEAAAALNAGCPLDLHDVAFPAGSATRTLLGKTEIVLIRPTAAPTYHIECWRSFATYTHGFLIEAVHGL